MSHFTKWNWEKNLQIADQGHIIYRSAKLRGVNVLSSAAFQGSLFRIIIVFTRR